MQTKYYYIVRDRYLAHYKNMSDNIFRMEEFNKKYMTEGQNFLSSPAAFESAFCIPAGFFPPAVARKG